ncbi:MAG TPA: hypothetical protein VNR41_13785 [Xanthobacteraceae bacterium]|jgi:hypothetical protein|nr:hypothetical protein [Xanthobacteraceae bacterium]
MLLGDLLARFRDESIATETVLGCGDLVLIAGLMEQASLSGQTLGAYAASAVRRYAAGASDEEWVTLMGALGRAEDPGIVCMRRAFDHALQQDRSALHAIRA